jgi:hypothetical protein
MTVGGREPRRKTVRRFGERGNVQSTKILVSPVVDSADIASFAKKWKVTDLIDNMYILP